MRPAALALLLAGALAGAGCGEEEVTPQDTVRSAVIGLAKGDAQRACAQVTPGAEKKLLRVLDDNAIAFLDIKADSCEEAIRKLHANLPPALRDVLEEGDVEEAKIKGDSATVEVRVAFTTVQLRKLDGTWKITGGLFGS